LHAEVQIVIIDPLAVVAVADVVTGSVEHAAVVEANHVAHHVVRHNQLTDVLRAAATTTTTTTTHVACCVKRGFQPTQRT